MQDDWRATQRLTIHAGLRYEYQFLPLPQQPNAALDVVFGAVGATSVFPEDRNNFGPRLGLAWQPFGVGRGVLRVGYGVYNGKLPGATIRAALLDTALPSSVTRVRILPTTGDGLSAVCHGSRLRLRLFLSHAAHGRGCGNYLGGRIRPALPSADGAAGNPLHRARTGCGVLGSARYVLNLDRQLPNSVDINIAPSSDVQEFQLRGGTGSHRRARWRDVRRPCVLGAHHSQLWACDEPHVKRQCQLPRAHPGGAAWIGRNPIRLQRGCARTGVPLGLDLVKGNRLRAERFRGATHQRPVRPLHRALR